MKLYSIETGNFKLDGGAMFGVVPKVLWNRVYPSDENNLCNWALRCMLVVDGNKRILIDTGIGDKQDDKFLKNYYLNGSDTMEKSLGNLGFTFNDITDVVLTHLHFDHCGGSIKYNEKNELVPAFANATYHTSEQQWAWATHPNRREKASYLYENINPIKESGQLNLFNSDTELFPGFTARLFNGHTDGQVIPHIKVNGKTFVYCADFFPSSAHLPMPYVCGYDTRPLISLDERKQFFEEAIEKDYILFFEHDLYHECCNLQETDKGVRVKEFFKLSDFFKEN